MLMEVQPSIREIIDPWTRIGYQSVQRVNLLGESKPATKIVFIHSGAIQSRILYETDQHGPSLLYKRNWYSVDVPLVQLDTSSDYWSQLVL